MRETIINKGFIPCYTENRLIESESFVNSRIIVINLILNY